MSTSRRYNKLTDFQQGALIGTRTDADLDGDAGSTDSGEETSDDAD